jgi:hypothetical protein
MGQVTRQQPSIGLIGLIAFTDRFTVMHQLSWVDQVDLKAQTMSLFDQFQMITRSGFDGDPDRSIHGLEPGFDIRRLILQRRAFFGIPIENKQLVLGYIDSEGDFRDCNSHNDLRGKRLP